MQDEVLRRYWHPVARSVDVQSQPIAARLLDERMVVFRLDGRPVALRDLCIHRGTPLSLGSVRDGRIVCAYHGWEYDGTGTCVRIPSLPAHRAIPRKARVDCYRAEDRHGLVWVCLGEPVLPIPEFPEFDDPDYHTIFMGQHEWDSSAARLAENFTDTTHFAFVHEGLLGDRDRAVASPIRVVRTAGGLQCHVERPNGETIFADIQSLTHEITLPFTIRQIKIDPSGGRQVLFITIAPVSKKQLKRFLYLSRNCQPDRADEEFVAFTMTVMNQDRTIVEAQRPEELPLDLTEELHVKGVDDPAIAYRRLLAEVGIDND